MGWDVKLLGDHKAPNVQLLDVKPSDSGPSDGQSTDGQGTDGHCADGKCAQREAAYRKCSGRQRAESPRRSDGRSHALQGVTWTKTIGHRTLPVIRCCRDMRPTSGQIPDT